ncbi:hypothetical protein [Siphonobacter curvatus]|uniref:Uncharacterized protein n=1 Tax=Siphonobacter curvatus TaxID=2094562 RepID=A0A2S7INF3_9BACT|nr:hypothetical protein [Siphonobacter curvatus]PQA59138.1 hypothetical protein C5O19_05645 [Siphonobacter curvatus]
MIEISTMTRMEQLRKLWFDGTIKPAGKSEIIRLFNKEFHYKPGSNDSWGLRINGTVEPTPAQEDFMDEYITKYYERYKQKAAKA